jgi:hypothetical protein
MQISNSGKEGIQRLEISFNPSELRLFTNIIIKSYQKGQKTEHDRLTEHYRLNRAILSSPLES